MIPVTTPHAGLWSARLLECEILPSTNTWALEHLDDLRHGDIVLAHHQAAGRGRFDREWLSPPGTCLTLSVILDSPAADDPKTAAATRMAACALHGTLEGCEISARLKWPNDVLVNDRKIAGILAERDAEAGKLVVGIGLNVNLSTEALSGQDLLQPATSMAIELNREIDIVPVRSSLVRNLEASLGMESQQLQAVWAAHDALVDKRITISTLKGETCGEYAGMDDKGRLRLETADGNLLRFDSGDVKSTRS